jgi:hypothetical protein
MMAAYNCTCPICLHYIQFEAGKGFPLHTCSACGHLFTAWDVYSSVTPAVEQVIVCEPEPFECCENPKRHRHPDWIEQWEELDLRSWITPAGL